MSLYFQPTPIRTQDSTMPTAPDEGLNIPALIDSLTNRIVSAEKTIEQKVSSNALAKILITEKDIVMMADQISLVGQINIFDWVRDVSGNITGGIDPASMTRIVGGKIQTGSISSTNWTTTTGSRIDLDNGTIALGGSSSPKFSVTSLGVMSCTDALVTGTLQAGSVITNSVTVDGVSLATISSKAASGYNIQQALEVSGTTILKGVLVPTDTGAMKCGTIAWDTSTGAWTSGSGIAITEYGIIGANGSNTTFTIDTSGNATFAGSLSAATGTFSGTVSAGAITSSTYVDVSGYIRVTGNATTNGGIYAIYGGGYTSAYTENGVCGETYSGMGVVGRVYSGNSNQDCGVLGEAIGGTYGIGVYGSSAVANANGIGVLAESIGSGSDFALVCRNGKVDLGSGVITTTSATLVTNLNADMLDGTHKSGFVLNNTANVWTFGGGTVTGATTATFVSTNKPGVDSSNTWVKLIIDSTTVYIPVWT